MVAVESESRRRHRMRRTKRSLLNLNLDECIGCIGLNGHC